jgi:tetratricopeptide (TPR) repeat protein
MNLLNCYRLLGLNSGAELEEIKSSYRRLARQYHPDANPGDREAEAHFIRLTEAYKCLIGLFEDSKKVEEIKKASTRTRIINVTETQPEVRSIEELSAYDRQLKWNCYNNLQELLKNRRFARAITLVEGLAQRLPHDREVRQWQAITYQQWGRQLLERKERSQAKIYLQKALQTDPHNRSLCAEIEKDLRRMQQIIK